MKFLFLALTLTIAPIAFGKTILTCDAHNSVFMTLEVSRDGAVTGRMNHNYNGALIACKQGAMESLEAGEASCVGLWNMAFNQRGESVDRAVIITLTKTDGKIQARFRNNWDGRTQSGNLEMLDCRLEN